MSDLTDPSAVETTIAERAERAFATISRHRGLLAAVAVALLLVFGASTLVLQRRAAARQRLTDAFAAAVALSDAPLASEVEEARAALDERRKERTREREEKRAERRAARDRAADANAAAEDDDEAADMEDEAAALAEQQAEDEALERQHRGPKPFDDKAARQVAARSAFAAVADDHAPSRLRALAGLEVAHAAAEQNDRVAVRERLAELYGTTPRTDDLWSIVASRYATALEATGAVDEALAVLARFGEGEQRLLADEAGVQRARLLAAQGDFDKARDVLEDVQLKFPNSPVEDEIRVALLEMPAPQPAAVPAGDAPGAAALPAATPKEASAPAP